MKRQKYRLRVLGTHETLREALRQQAQEDLGIELLFESGSSSEVLFKASTQPESFDVYEQWSNSINILWSAGAIQPVDRKRIRYWQDINPLTKEGRLTEHSPYGKGDAPYQLLYVQSDNSLSSRQTGNISFVPYVHNVDSFGYNTRYIPVAEPYVGESWSWLFDERYRGRVALINEPTIGLFDAALAAQATGSLQFKDIGNLTRKEIDALFDKLITLKRKGQFRGVWNSVPESVALMKRNEVYLQSMFSPGVVTLNGQGVNCIYAAPKEGYRAWHGVMCLSSRINKTSKDAAYEYMNWWLSGWPGAFIARQGYYISTPELSRPYLTEAEWDYWYEGKPASTSLLNTTGEVSVGKGRVRNGGSYLQRFSNIAVWNTVMPTYEYSLSRWNEFLLS